MAEGYWGNSHWASGYWASGYWGQGGTPPIPSIPPVAWLGVKKRKFSWRLLELLREYFELKYSWKQHP